MESNKAPESIYTRTEMMLGKEGTDRLKTSRVAIFGVGGVGGFAAEAIARAGVGNITLIDPDKVSVTNKNRQIIALDSTIGMNKAEAMRERILDINPDACVRALPIFYSEENADKVDLSDFDYIVDAIDSVRSKIFLIEEAYKRGVRIICSMGAGNKLDPTRFRVSDIKKTTVDPLARAIRGELKKRGVDSLKVVFSDEPPTGERQAGKPGSISFVPSVVGIILAGEVIKDLSKSE